MSSHLDVLVAARRDVATPCRRPVPVSTETLGTAARALDGFEQGAEGAEGVVRLAGTDAG